MERIVEPDRPEPEIAIIFISLSSTIALLIGICFFKGFYRRAGPTGIEGVQNILLKGRSLSNRKEEKLRSAEARTLQVKNIQPSKYLLKK